MFYKFKFLLLATVVFVGTAFAQDEIELVKQGLNYSYNFNFQSSDSVYNLVIDKYPNSPSGYHFLSQNYLWKYMGGRDSADLIIFNKFSDMALDRADKIESPTNYIAYIASSIHALRAIANTFSGNTWDAFLESKKAVSGHELLIENGKKFYDAYAGLAVFDYALSELPALYRFALDLTGLSHDKEKAITYFEITYKNGSLARDEAAFHLSKVNFEYTGNYKKALQYIDELLEKYPNNILFKYQKSLIKIEQRELENAENILIGIIESDVSGFRQTVAYSYFLLGEIYFKRNDFTKALNYYEKFFATTTVIDYLGFANLRCALASGFIGDENNMNRYLFLSRNGNTDIAEDKFAEELSEAIIDKGISEEMRDFIFAENYYLAGNYDYFLDAYSEDDNSKYASVNVIVAAAFTELKRYDESERIAESLVNKKLLFDYLEPFLYLIRGENNYYLSNYRLAKKFLNIAKENADGYRGKYITSQANHFFSLINKR